VKPDLILNLEEAMSLARVGGFELDASDQDLRSIALQVWAAIKAYNDPPEIFRYGGGIVRLEAGEDGEFVLAPMTLDRTRHALARAVQWYRRTKSEKKAALPPMPVVRDILATPNPSLPVLAAISRCPTFDQNGTLNTAPGYSYATRRYYAPRRGFIIPPVSETPSDAEVQRAKDLVFETIQDFSFIADSERAHALGLGFSLFIRDLIDCPLPLHVIDKPSPGTGGTLLVEVLTFSGYRQTADRPDRE
jgi:hypothetical protein